MLPRVPMEQTDMTKSRGWRGSEDLWLDAAYDLLVTAGIDAVKVMPLAKKLGMSRTSFYWHFEDRDALLAALLKRWQAKNTDNLIAQTQLYAESFTEAMFNFFDCWLVKDLFDSRLDYAVRNWAQSDPAIRPVIEAADRKRIDAIIALFQRFGFKDELALARAHTVYYTQIGYIAMNVNESRADRLILMPSYVETYTGKKPTESEIARFMARHIDREK